MKKAIIFISFLKLLLITPVNGQIFEVRHKVYGQIIEEKSQMPVKKVPVRVLPYDREIYTDNQGEFLFNMPAGNFSLIINHDPFDKVEMSINLKSDTLIKIYLKTQSEITYIGEIEVNALQRADDLPENIRIVARNSLLQMPAIAGVKDINKLLALSAGVSSSSEGSADLQVRGGQAGQNLYLYDGIPIYATSHFFGLISATNPLSVQSAKLYKSGFPVEYGGRLSSIVSVKTRDILLTKTSFETEINMLTSGLRLSLPIVKNKIGLTISGRVSNYGGLNLLSLYNNDDNDKIRMSFGDLHTGLLWQPNIKNKLKVNWFTNNDNINIFQTDNTSESLSWLKNKQNNLSFTWNRTDDKTDNKLSVYSDKYGFDLGKRLHGNSTDFQVEDQIVSHISTVGIKDNLEITFSDKRTLITGFSFDQISFTPVWYQYRDSALIKEDVYKQTKFYEGFIYGSLNLNLENYGKVNLGFRSGLAIDNKQLFPLFEPRLSYQNVLESGFSFNASIDRMSQTVHRIANPGLGYPFEIYLPSTDGIKPSDLWIYSLGGSRDIRFNKLNLTLKAELWYKRMKNIVEFKDGYDVISAVTDKSGITTGMQNVVTQGRGEAYGIDFSGEVKLKKFTLLTDYTLMRSIWQFDELNNGIAFNAPTDIRNSISITLLYNISDKWKFSSNWQYMSGKPITLPELIFKRPNYNILTGELSESQFYYELTAENRNIFRTKPFHKLDMEINYTYTAFKKFKGNISIGVYNAYNQYNPFIYIQRADIDSDGKTKNLIKSLSLFPVMPTFNWSLQF